MRKLVFMFTGQGSHHPEMFSRFEHKFMSHPITKQVLGDNFITKLKAGPEPLPTSFTQPLIVLHSLALFDKFNDNMVSQKVPAIGISSGLGHSLGEFTAITAAGGLKFEEVMPLVHRRGQLMEEEMRKIGKKTAMTAIIRPPHIDYKSFLKSQSDLVCDLANVNSPEQIVLSGFADDVKEGISRIRKYVGEDAWKNTRTIPLRTVSAPFHCRLMEPVSRALIPQFNSLLTEDRDLKFPIITNCDAELIVLTDELAESLSHQAHSTVRWDESVQKAFQYVQEANNAYADVKIQFIEFGPTQLLIPLLRKILPFGISSSQNPTTPLRADYIGSFDDVERVTNNIIAEDIKPQVLED
jgi:[acyl-carrier-protein] S-malonyltransferase